MVKKYVATIMKRLYLGEDNYIFYPNYTAIGAYDEQSGIFTDRNGKEFFAITNPYVLQTEISEGFANLEEMSKIPQIVGQQSMRDAIAEYDYDCSRALYYVSATEDGLIFSIPIDYVQIKQELEKSLAALKESGNLDNFVSSHTNGGEQEPSKQEPGEEIKLLSGDVREDIAAFFMNLMDGVYSLDDLREIRQNVESQRDDIDALLDSIDLQIEASENGVSSNRLRGEEAIRIPKRKETKEKQPVKKINVPHYLDIEDLFKKITKTLIAQDEPTRRVLIEIARKEQSEQNNDRGILITGPTGCGKTKMMELIARYLDRPFLKVDSTQLTIPGYVGKDIEEVLWELYIKCGRDVKKAERAIIFFDEIDKKGSSRKDDISGKGVLNVLLPFFDGTTYDACENMKQQREIVKINTKNMLVILGGAFEDVYKDLRSKNRVGFATNPIEEAKEKQATTEDFVNKAKMPSEFMGRVAIVKLNDLDLESIKRILLESDESAIRIQQRLFDELGVKLTPSEEYIDAIAEQAQARKTGARGLNTVVDESTWEAYGDAYTHLGEYEEIILERETVTNPKQYVKIKRSK